MIALIDVPPSRIDVPANSAPACGCSPKSPHPMELPWRLLVAFADVVRMRIIGRGIVGKGTKRMDSIIYLVGLIVVVMFILSVLGLR